MTYTIAIDGPSASGKSSVAKIIAEKNNLLFFSSGLIFRAFAYCLIKNNLLKESTDEQVIFLQSQTFEFIDSKVFLNNDEIASIIKDSDISKVASDISKKLKIRELFNIALKKICASNDLIMDGRDIGTIVIPNASLKIFLVASSWKRAKRRRAELSKINNRKINLLKIWLSIVIRDWNDRHRKISPLKKAKDAIKINSSNKTIDQIVQEIQKYIKR